MRRATTGTQWIESEDGQFLGINLGADFCAEHEWGIKGIRAAFGIGKGGDIGIPARQVTETPVVWLFENKRHVLLVFAPGYNAEEQRVYWERQFKQRKKYDVYPVGRELNLRVGEAFPDKDGMVTAWDEGSFAIHAVPEHAAKLRQIYDALQRKDAAIFLGGGGMVFQNAGLTILIVSRLPVEWVEKCRAVDQEAINLENAGKIAGIDEVKELLKSRGKNWFFLGRPRWFQEQNNPEFLKFWLNPYEQDKCNFGWYTIEELRAWADDKGPIPKLAQAVGT